MKPPARPFIQNYPSSRAESFTTAREDQFSTTDGGSRSGTPLAAEHQATAGHDRSLGLAFEGDDNDSASINWAPHALSSPVSIKQTRELPLRGGPPKSLTLRKTRTSAQSPQKPPSSVGTASPASLRSFTKSQGRAASITSSPNAQSIETFAQSIGWPLSNVSADPDASTKRYSTSSMGSTIVPAMVVVTPERARRRTLRHSGKNLAYLAEDNHPLEPPTPYLPNRDSSNLEDIPLHRLIHKRATISDRKKRFSSDSTTGTMRTASPLSVHQYTVAHQESVRTVLQPAADIMSRSNSQTRPQRLQTPYHKRISSAPEPGRRESLLSGEPSESKMSLRVQKSTKSSLSREVSPSSPSPEQPSPKQPEAGKQSPVESRREAGLSKPLPQTPNQSPKVLRGRANGRASEGESAAISKGSAQHLESRKDSSAAIPDSPPLRRSSPDLKDTSPRAHLARAQHGWSPKRQRGSLSPVQHESPRLNLERVPNDEVSRKGDDSRSVHTDDHRISFDRSSIRTEEHAMARHLFAATPFSQFSDTPIEVSEATAVSIYPHTNNSLLVVQQLARPSNLSDTQAALDDGGVSCPEHDSPQKAVSRSRRVLTPEPFQPLDGPTVTVEPSTPPLQSSLPAPGAVDSPLRNPRAAPEPPVVKLIPPTPAEELERQLEAHPPGPPKRSDSHPQRRLSLVQRARRYSGGLITPILARTASTRTARNGDDPLSHDKPQMPTVTDGDGALHPFWRPRGFWDDLEGNDSDPYDDRLPQGGDTSDIDEPTPRKLGTLGRRLTNGFKGTGGFLIGNSLGVERAGSNRRRHHVELPSRRTADQQAPKILVQRPTFPLGIRTNRVGKRGSKASMRSIRTIERPGPEARREAWRKGKRIPGVGLQVQYIGLSGVKERLRERKAEKRRDEIRKSIGSRYYIDGGQKV